jgi:hypothetical protein
MNELVIRAGGGSISATQSFGNPAQSPILSLWAGLHAVVARGILTPARRAEKSLRADELAQFRRPWRGEDLFRLADLVDAALMHEDNARADVAGKAHLVGDH